jgi:regulator of nucleoside diphosphate kinase
MRVARITAALCFAALLPIMAQLLHGAVPLPVYGLTLVVLVYCLATQLEVPMERPEIIVTEQDADRLSRLLDALSPKQRSAASALELELERARVVAAGGVPGDVVTMNSRVRFEELHSGQRTEARLVYPSDARAAADANEDAISVLAPVGSALLGMRVGQSIDWRMPSGRLRRYQIVDVVYQPEAAGDAHL